MADAISIEETNKIRAAIGLKPLPVPGAPAGPTFKEHSSDDSSDEEEPASTLDTREAAGYGNYKKLQDDAAAKKARDARIAAIKKAKDAAQKFVRLEGKGLGDEDDRKGDLDTKSWLVGQKKRQKKLEKERARKMEEELAERERLAAVEYGSRDLAGVKVAHEVGEFEEEDGEQILTLKDTTIDENEEEGDELENISLKEREKLKEKLELKKKKPVYDPNAIEEDGESKILAQYDEEIDGKKRKRFTLDGMGAITEERDAKRQEVGERLRAQLISLDVLRDETKSDYMDVSEIKIKKPKKAKKKTRQKAADDEDDIFPVVQDTDEAANTNGDAMQMDSTVQATRAVHRSIETSFVDDEDLQASLAAQRRAAFKKRKRQRPEDLARALREEASATPDMEVDDGDWAEEEPGLVIDETSEFVSNLQRPTVPEQKPHQSVQPSIEASGTAKSPSPEEGDGDVKMESYNDIEDEEELLARLKRERSTTTPDVTHTGLEEETTLDAGMGATLNLLKQRGLVKSADMGDVNALHRDRQRFLAEKQRREGDAERRARLQRERDRASGKFDKMSAREREEYSRQFNKARDQDDSRKMADAFNREYKPDVQLKYMDEFGRSMTQKEAFKSLSHDFHGKGSGKQKTEKRLKKIEDERKRESASMLDSSQATGMNNAMGATAKKNRQAGVRLG